MWYRLSALIAAAAVLGLAASSTSLVGGVDGLPLRGVAAAGVAPWPATVSVLGDARARALRRARVFRQPQNFPRVSSGTARLLTAPLVNCRFVLRQTSGTTPKFDCLLPDGEVVKVKYGRNPELHAEAAATRLLAAVGFGADEVAVVPRVRCSGCPRFPFQMMRLLELASVPSVAGRLVRYDRSTDFEWVGLERRFPGAPIEADGVAGWGWFELDTMAGASRAERDALRLMAVFLAHWDNKMENQRLVCLDEGARQPGDHCRSPFALIQDVGATFGPRKLDLARWRATPIWRDAKRCTVSMRELPWGGGTFVDAEISEAGRQLLAAQLRRLTPWEVTELFTAARFGEFERGRWFGPPAPVSAWVSAFQDKVRQIVEAGPCPRSQNLPT